MCLFPKDEQQRCTAHKAKRAEARHYRCNEQTTTLRCETGPCTTLGERRVTLFWLIL